jgi:hypothetical protein
MTVDVKVNMRGPLFDGSASGLLTAFEADAAEQVAQAAHQQLHRAFGATFRNPTGYYKSRTVTELRSNGATVHDSNVIYGNWLEGTSHRNTETRFKGYHNYRKVTQNIRKLAPRMVERILAGYVRRLNG